MEFKEVKIGVLGGGVSQEREISLISAKNVYEVLKGEAKEVVLIDILDSDKKIVKKVINENKIDLAFIALHGEFGEDGTIQTILEELSIPYTGSGPEASYLAMDKIASKGVFIKKGIDTPDFKIFSKKDKLPKDVEYPVVVKPNFSGSSFGISIVESESGLAKAFKEALSVESGDILLEKCIKGRELTVGILGDKPLAVVEIIPKASYYDYNAKYADEETKLIVPANLNRALYSQVQVMSLKVHEVLGCRYFSRVDIILDKDEIPYVIEVNSIPGFTSHSLLPLSAKASGLNFKALILEIVRLVINESKQKQKI